MTDLPPQIPLVDPGNQFINDYPGMLATGPTQTAQGPRLVLTIRCGPATLTCLLDRDTAKAWAANIDDAASKLPTLLLPPNGFHLPENPT